MTIDRLRMEFLASLPKLSSLFFSRLCGCLAPALLGPSAGERVAHAVIVLVTRGFENRADRSPHRDLAGPRPHPGMRIVDSELVEDLVVRDSREPFRHDHVLARAPERRLVGQVASFDDER